jgi:hypothetical protein
MIHAANDGWGFRSSGDLTQSLFADGTEKRVLISTEPVGSMVSASLPMTILLQDAGINALQITCLAKLCQQMLNNKLTIKMRSLYLAFLSSFQM